MVIGSVRLAGGLSALALCATAAACSEPPPQPTASPASGKADECPPGELCHRTFLPVVAHNAPYRPLGFGLAGGGQWQEHDRWFYSWGYTNAAMYGTKRFMPMLWGGPPADYCNPDIAPPPDPSQCTCNWITWPSYRWGNQCNPGCANAETSYVPAHLPGCTEAQRVAYGQKIADFIAADPKRRGRNWLVYNEPENLDQAALDPREAALLYDALYQRVHAVDPSARFYCCGAMAHNDPARRWLADFAAHVTRPLDGIHYHNYYPPSWFDAAEIEGVMSEFHAFLQGLHTAGGQHLGDLELVITEWAGLVKYSDQHACAGANNRDNVMRPVAKWLNTVGRTKNHVAAAWFVANWDEMWPSCSLFDADGERTCLGDEYFSYRWGAVP